MSLARLVGTIGTWYSLKRDLSLPKDDPANFLDRFPSIDRLFYLAILPFELSPLLGKVDRTTQPGIASSLIL
jgi:hypothetical protein